MKKIMFLFVAGAAMLASCKQSGTTENTTTTTPAADPNAQMVNNPATPAVPSDTINVAKMKFTEEVYSYGKVKAGDKVHHTFKFTNVGKVPLVISNAASTCGCTVPTWPKEPVAPGASSEISVEFNTQGKSGPNKKPINITANTWPTVTTVHIDGEVTPDPNAKPAEPAKTGAPAPTAPAKGH